MNMTTLDEWKIHWCLFTEYHKYCDQLTMNTGACYSFVFHETKPESYQRPSDFQDCCYIGKSSGHYVDKQSGMKTKLRSHVHKRMTTHLGALVNESKQETSHQRIIEKYGQGTDVFNGTLTGKPCWLGLILPRPDLNEKDYGPWCQMAERHELYLYQRNFGCEPVGNLDNGTNKNPESFSSQYIDNLNALPFD